MIAFERGHKGEIPSIDQLNRWFAPNLCCLDREEKSYGVNTLSGYGILHELLAGKEYTDTVRSELMHVLIVRLPEEEKADWANNLPSQLHTLLSTVFPRNCQQGTDWRHCRDRD